MTLIFSWLSFLALYSRPASNMVNVRMSFMLMA